MNTIERALWDVGAISVDVSKPFLLKSGILSPIYIDCRRIISYPAVRRQVTDAFFNELNVHGGVDVVAGCETAGIPLAAWLSERADLPLVYVRKKAKGHGKRAQVEGELKEGQRVVLCDDVITDGGSKKTFIAGLRSAGGRPVGCYVIIDREAGGVAFMARSKVRLSSLSTLSRLVRFGLENGKIAAEQHSQLDSFLRDPFGWSLKRVPLAAPVKGPAQATFTRFVQQSSTRSL